MSKMDEPSKEDATEKTRLIPDSLKGKSYNSASDNVFYSNDVKTDAKAGLSKHIGLAHAIGIMVGSVAGTGIFVSPTGVTKELGSVGATLIMWAANGLFNLLLALCYAELGTALPVAGGDYAYIDYVLGKLPAFLCLWLMVVLIGPCAIAVAARTVAAYLATSLGLTCYTSLSIVVSIFVVLTSTVLNCSSALWSSRMITIFSIGKVLAMGFIVILGIVNLSLGYTDNFQTPFAHGVTDPARIMMSFLPAFFTLAGWDLPIATVVSVLLVTGIYVMMNVAYFTVLTPLEFIESDAVASLFAERTMASAAFLIPVFIIISSTGSVLNLTLACPRWGFAGGRNKALPILFSHIHINSSLPLPSILVTALLSVFFCLAVFFDIQDLLNITSVIVQIKIVLALVALLILKRREPNKPSTVTVPFLLVLLATIVLTAFTVLPLWQTPAVGGTAFGVFLLGVPLYFVQKRVGNWDCTKKGMDTFTKVAQLLLQVIPTSRSKDE